MKAWEHIRIAAQWRKWAGIKILPQPGIRVNTESRHWLIVLLSRHQSVYLLAFPGQLWIALWHPEESEPVIVAPFRLRKKNKTKKHEHRMDMLCLNCFWNNRSRISNQVSTSQSLVREGTAWPISHPPGEPPSWKGWLGPSHDLGPVSQRTSKTLHSPGFDSLHESEWMEWGETLNLNVPRQFQGSLKLLDSKRLFTHNASKNFWGF